MRLPAVLTDVDLPTAELSALRLDGEAYALDGCLVPVDSPDLPSVRAAVVAARFSTRYIACGPTAAWLHGALDEPPATHELCVPLAHRLARPLTGSDVRVREMTVAADELVSVGPIAVTDPGRTVIDLARFLPRFDDAARRVCERLLGASGTSARQLRGRVQSASHMTARGIALARLVHLDADRAAA